MFITYRNKLFCIMLLSILSIPLNTQEANATFAESTTPCAAGCLLGGAFGTLVFPGPGTVIGCAVVGLGVLALKIVQPSKSDEPQIKDNQSELLVTKDSALNEGDDR